MNVNFVCLLVFPTFLLSCREIETDLISVGNKPINDLIIDWLTKKNIDVCVVCEIGVNGNILVTEKFGNLSKVENLINGISFTNLNKSREIYKFDKFIYMQDKSSMSIEGGHTTTYFYVIEDSYFVLGDDRIKSSIDDFLINMAYYFNKK